IELRVPNEPIVIDGDRRRLQQVLLNLIANAVQHGASAAGTEVHVRSEPGVAVIAVRDHGPGIAADDRVRVFERFYQAERGVAPGLGVGLYLTHAIVTAHGGTIQVDPTEPGGTTVTVRLPRAMSGPGGA